jgi:VWFA-related protein
MNLAETRRKFRTIVVLDQGGDEVMTPESAFRNVNQFAVTLASLNRNAALFAAAAELRAQHRLAESELVRGNGLLRSGELLSARDAFELVLEHTRKQPDALAEQRARLGIASIDIDRNGHTDDALRELRDIAFHPLAKDTGISAFLLLGHRYKLEHRTGAAIDAYQHAWSLAPKPSPAADEARRYLEMLGATPASDVAAAAATGEVHLVFARRLAMVGKLEVTATAPPSAARVEFFLDGARVVEDTEAPFAATIALGSAPRMHTIAAKAFDTRNGVVGEASATINDVADALSVRVVAPASIESRAPIAVEVRAPIGATIDSVDLYWSDRKLATLTAPPYRYELTLPSRNASGYLRAVVHDSTGATAEDVRMINAAGPAEEMQVELVEVYAVVQERGGRNVEGLAARDFVVKEDGVPVDVELRGTPNDPIAVGFVLDTSSSMRPLMVDVDEDAAEFVNGSLAAGDRAFVMAFSDRPQLVQPLTGDLKQVRASILDTQPGGSTAIWDALIAALQQLRAVQGKRALLLFTDGADTASSASRDTALAVAQEVGVPVYVFLMRDVTSRPPDVLRLERIARDSGGAIFKSPRAKDLPRLFAQIRDDTRGEYLLSFFSKSERPRTELRTISVSVPGRSATVRAMSGYYPR